MGYDSVCAKLANEGRRVAVVFDRADMFLASPQPPPDFIRKSRLVTSTKALELGYAYSMITDLSASLYLIVC